MDYIICSIRKTAGLEYVIIFSEYIFRKFKFRKYVIILYFVNRLKADRAPNLQ